MTRIRHREPPKHQAAVTVGWERQSSPLLEEGALLHQNLLLLLAALLAPCKRGLSVHEASHLLLPSRTAGVEGLLHPVALGLQVLAVLLLLGFHRLLTELLLARLRDLLVQVRLQLLEGHLFCIQRLQALERSRFLLLELLLG